MYIFFQNTLTFIFHIFSQSLNTLCDSCDVIYIFSGINMKVFERKNRGVCMCVGVVQRVCIMCMCCVGVMHEVSISDFLRFVLMGIHDCFFRRMFVCLCHDASKIPKFIRFILMGFHYCFFRCMFVCPCRKIRNFIRFMLMVIHDCFFRHMFVYPCRDTRKITFFALKVDYLNNQKYDLTTVENRSCVLRSPFFCTNSYKKY